MLATPLQNQFANWAFEYVAEGADVGELEAIANDMADDSDGAYYDAWYGHATRHRTHADEARRRGRDHTARYHYLRATVYASVSYKLLFGTPVDPRLKTAFATQDSAFRRAMALTNPPAEPLDVRLGRQRLDVLFIRAPGSGRHRRPTIILVNGYDATISDEEQRLHVDRRVHRRSGGEELLRVGHLLSSRAANLAQLNERPPMRGNGGAATASPP
jgi:hypothetical protein